MLGKVLLQGFVENFAMLSGLKTQVLYKQYY